MEQDKLELISKLQTIPENKLTNEIIIPLLENLGFEKVEFFGGPSEFGKDIVCWEFDKIGDPKLIVAQVKHLKLSNKAADNNSLQTAISQLTTCFKKPLLYTDKTVHLPSEVWLISTYEIDTKTLETRFGHFPDLADQKIKLIDGAKLASLLIKHRPLLVRQILGLNVGTSIYLQDSLTNETLLRALGYNQVKEITDVFINIDFSLGKQNTHLFFKGAFSPKDETLLLEENDWNEFKTLCLNITKVFRINFLKNSFEYTEQEYYLSGRNIRPRLQKLYDSITKEFEDKLQERVSSERKRLLEKKYFKAEDSFERISAEIRGELEIEKRRKIEALEFKHGIAYKPILNGKAIVDALLSKRRWIENLVSDYNAKKLSIPSLKTFLEECNEIINTASSIFSHPRFFSCIGNDRKKFLRNDFETTRFKLPIQDVFDTNLNIAVLGEAGAGKTTSLQVYGINKLKDNSKIVLFISLANLAQQIYKTYPNIFEPSKPSQLDEMIGKYLETKGLLISTESFRNELSSKKMLLLLDGIDEVIKLTPWLPDAIVNFAQKYEKTVQVITSSRMSGAFLNQFPFFAVTILPFTDEQRRTFIEKWFAGENNEIVNRINKHIEKYKGLADIVNNPLLTTTLCVLAKNEIPLPNSEIKLYNERMKLLSGYYDLARSIKARTESTPQTLEIVAQKLAFYFQFDGLKEAYIDDIKKNATRLFSKVLSEMEISMAVDELINPCNILVPMTDDGKYGFGHLRYQEFLAAKEISTNRSIKIFDLQNNSWWHDTLILFGQMNSNLYWLIDNIGKNGNIYQAEEILKEMILARPKHDHKTHYDRINIYLGVDRIRDERFEGFSNSDLE